MDIDTLRHAVEDAFATTGADTPGWDDPHPDRSPRDEEYSRVSDWDKYAIVAARARAWGLALVASGLAKAVQTAGAVELWPTGPGALPLRLSFTPGDAVSETGVTVSAGSPPVEVVCVPQCGCDACDDGSAHLLDELDEHILAVLTGDFVHFTAPGAVVTSTGPFAYSASFTRDGRGVDVRAMVDAAREGTSPYPVVRGRAWY